MIGITYEQARGNFPRKVKIFGPSAHRRNNLFGTLTGGDPERAYVTIGGSSGTEKFKWENIIDLVAQNGGPLPALEHATRRPVVVQPPTAVESVNARTSVDRDKVHQALAEADVLSLGDLGEMIQKAVAESKVARGMFKEAKANAERILAEAQALVTESDTRLATLRDRAKAAMEMIDSEMRTTA